MIDRNIHLGPLAESPVQDHDIARPHPNAAEACRRANSPFFRGSVNVDRPLKGVLILRFHTLQPEDAGDNRIASRSIDLHDFASRAAIFEFHPERSTIAYFCGDLQSSERRIAASRAVSYAEAGGGNLVPADLFAFVVYGELLVSDADADGVIMVHRGTRGEEAESGDRSEGTVKGRCHGSSIADGQKIQYWG